MTRKIYRSAMGKEVDLGALLLQNEQVRAVGNMNVNARGDRLDSTNKVIDKKNQQVQRQYKRTVSNVSATTPVHTSNLAAKKANENTTLPTDESIDLSELNNSVETESPVTEIVTAPEPLPENTFGPTGEGGLAAAIARSRLIKQEKEKTLKERQQAQGLRKI